MRHPLTSTDRRLGQRLESASAAWRCGARTTLAAALLCAGALGCKGDPGPAGATGPIAEVCPNPHLIGPVEIPTALPTGQFITPLAAPCSTLQYLNPGLAQFPDFVVGQLISEAMTADGKTLALLTSGFNNNLDASGKVVPSASNEYVFLFDVSATAPVQKQVIQVATTYQGIAFSPDGKRLVVTGGSQDSLHVFAAGAPWTEVAGSPIPLGHNAAPSSVPWATVIKPAQGLSQRPMAQGVAITADNHFAVVANRYNDSITVVDLATNAVAAELDLRPGKNGGAPGGEYPNSVAIVGSATAYVSSERDREVVAVDIATPTAPAITARIPVPGNPNKMVLNQAQTTLYVAQDNADVVSAINTADDTLATSISTVAPAGSWVAGRRYKGASPNAVAIAPDGKRLYVSNRGTNSIAVVDLTGAAPVVTGLIPTAWYPSDVAVSADSSTLYVVNLKSIPGANTGACYQGTLGAQAIVCPVPDSPAVYAPNQYILALSKGSFATIPVPVDGPVKARLTAQVAQNNGFSFVPGQSDAEVMAALKANIKHVIYIIKENRTYDQMLGDLGTGNGDPDLAEFPQATTPSTAPATRAGTAGRGACPGANRTPGRSW